MTNVAGEALLEDRRILVKNLRGVLNGGPCQFVGELIERVVGHSSKGESRPRMSSSMMG